MFKASTNVKKVADFYFSTTRIRLREGCVSTNHDIDFLPIIGRPAVATYRTEKTDREFRTREKLQRLHRQEGTRGTSASQVSFCKPRLR